jgi:hypothetical protein
VRYRGVAARPARRDERAQLLQRVCDRDRMHTRAGRGSRMSISGSQNPSITYIALDGAPAAHAVGMLERWGL